MVATTDPPTSNVYPLIPLASVAEQSIRTLSDTVAPLVGDSKVTTGGVLSGLADTPLAENRINAMNNSVAVSFIVVFLKIIHLSAYKAFVSSKVCVADPDDFSGYL